MVFVVIMAVGFVINVLPIIQPAKASITPIFPTPPQGGSSSGSSTTSTGGNSNGGQGGSGGSGGTNSVTVTTTTTTTSTTMPNSPEWNSQWLSYSKTAWQFFGPGYGVSSVTGLICGSAYWHSFTDWDLGGYIFAILSAEKLGLIKETGTWGVNYRLTLVLNFLDTRPLAPNNLTYQFYDSDTGTVSSSYAGDGGNIYDEGRLLIALHELMVIHPEFTSQIEAAINRVNYTYFASTINFDSTDLYTHYAAIGFELWGFGPSSLPNFTAPYPGSMIGPDASLFSILEGVSDQYLSNAAAEDYVAQYAYYNKTGEITSLGEGEYPTTVDPSAPYIYEAVSVPTGSSIGVLSHTGQNVTTGPEAFVKIGFAFYAVYRSTYGAFLVKELGSLSNSHGFEEGILTSQNNQIFNQDWDDTNILIMEASAYAITGS
jgi:hypothetical protein